jgi:hypothetical protein
LPEDRVSESDTGSRKIKVVDRRRFDDSGEPRPDRPPPEKTERPAASAGPAATLEHPSPKPSPPKETVAQGPEAASSPPTQPLFLDLVAGLAQQAEMLLTGAQGMPAAPAEAQQVIDVLTMLERKTRGNLSAEEQQILSNVIFQLRTMYLQHGK